MKRLLLQLLLVPLPFINVAQESQMMTYYEKSGFKATPSYDETVAYCKLLDEASPAILYTTFGKSPQGRDLPLLIIDAEGNFSPETAREKGKLVVLIEAGIHPGEIDGKDAGLMFFRDLAVKGEFDGIPEHLTFLFIPIFNVDGHERSGPYNRINQDGPEEMGWRTTAQNLNLNRDFLKADAPEMQDWLRLYHRWKPDFFADIHVTDGADYQYVMTYGLEDQGNMDEGLTDFTRREFIPDMEQYMDQAGYPAFPYVMFRRWHDPRSGLRSGAAGPKYSQGYTAAQNRIGMLVENHSLENYETRVNGTYELLKFLTTFLEENHEEIIKLNQIADRNTAGKSFRKEPFVLSYKTGTDSIMVDFRGVEYDVLESDLTGGDWFIYHPDKPVTFQVPYFYKQVPVATAMIPEAYIVPVEWSEIIEKLALHGINYFTLQEPVNIPIEAYRFTRVEYARSTFEGRLQVTPTFEKYQEERAFPAGSVIVPTDQASARIIAHMFEPASPDSYLQWGFFNSIFERKEYFETYVMEPEARKMMAETPGLKEEFEQWKALNPEAAQNQWAQLEWFYNRSHWADAKLNVYPVGRIVDREVLEGVGR